MGQMRVTLFFASSIGLAVAAACGSNGGNGASSADAGGDGMSSSGASSGGSSGGFGSSSGADGAPVADADFPCDGCAPFPPQDAGACSPQTLGNPTLVYPPDGVLLPPNMNVLEVQWVPPTGATLYEVDFTNGITDVRIETPCNEITSVRGVANVGCGLTLSQQAWNDIANTNRDGDPVNVTVRATPANMQCVTASQQSVSIAFAKDNLTGGIYYWQSATYGGIAGTTGGIYYHDFGTFTPTPTPFWTSGGTGTCVGCHTLSKDGVRMAVMNDDPDADDEYGDVHMNGMDVATRTIIKGGNSVGPGFQTFTHDHAQMIATSFHPMGGMMGPPPMMGMDQSFNVWDGNTFALLASDALPSGMYGDHPNLSWDDKTLVFVAPSVTNNMSSISMAGDHHFLGGSLWSASFDTTSHGLSNFTELLAASGQENFYYPDQSVDGKWLVFNENDDTSAANNDGDCFYSRQAAVKIMHFPPQTGDVPLTLTNLNVGTGLSNSWPRWSPAPTSYHGAPVLWVTFSSNRDYGLHLKNGGFDNYYPPESPTYDQPQPASKQGITFDNYAAPQIWMAAVVIDPNRALDSKDRSYPAFWLPFQDVTAHNHSAQWVAQVQGPPGTDGGTSSSSGSSSGGSPMCGESGATCGSGSALCCTDAVCCAGTCQSGCTQ